MVERRFLDNNNNDFRVLQIGRIGESWQIYSYGGSDYIQGGEGRDTIYGGDGHDLIIGSTSNESVFGYDNSRDTLRGGNGNDTINGNNGDDILAGQKGNDYLYGGSGNDRLYSHSGNDHLYGGSGNDTLSGTSYNSQGTGERDVMTSGSYSDQDLFYLGLDNRVFYNDQGYWDYARITDFDAYSFTGEIDHDKIAIVGCVSNYSIQYNIGTGDTSISYGGDLIAIVENADLTTNLAQNFVSI
ncbi:MAG: calcium-binding protein [Xenococcus sp. (in: cyanobacteria)]